MSSWAEMMRSNEYHKGRGLLHYSCCAVLIGSLCAEIASALGYERPAERSVKVPASCLKGNHQDSVVLFPVSRILALIRTSALSNTGGAGL